MADIIFRGTPWGDVIILDSWPQWQKDAWFSVLGAPPKPAWTPTFESHPTEQITDGAGKTVTYELNPRYFATDATAGELMKRYATAGVVGVAVVPFQGGGGNVSSAAQERWLLLAGGFATNAGLLAGHFVDNPEDTAPNVADNAVRRDLAAVIQSGQRLPTT